MSTSKVTTPLGSVIRDVDGYRLEFVREIPESIERVWAGITDSAELAGWYGTWTGDPTTGSVEVTFNEAPDSPSATRILECDAPRRLSVVVPSPDGDWPLSVALKSTSGGTTLTFVHRLAEPFDATGVGAGWHYYLDRLSAHLAGTKIPADWSVYEPLAVRYELPS